MEKEYIQLPALKRDLDPDVVKVLWAFIQLPEEYQARYQEQYELLNQRKEEADRQLQENIEKIDADAIHLYEETMRSMIRDIVQQSCNLACWVRYHKYDLQILLSVFCFCFMHNHRTSVLLPSAAGSAVSYVKLHLRDRMHRFPAPS